MRRRGLRMWDWVRGVRDSGRLGMSWMDEDALKPHSHLLQTVSYQTCAVCASLP